jgi:acyl-CoA reductase-like NAD-dependent aldehyde dehydrogenase
MKMTDEQISSIVNRVVDRLTSDKKIEDEDRVNKEAVKTKIPKKEKAPTASTGNRRGCFPDMDPAINAAHQAFSDYKSITIEQRKGMIAAIREICLKHLKEISQIALEETGLGRYDDKLKKNRLAILKTPGIEDVEPVAFTGDYGLTVLENAPYGVIGSITPCTNPTETIICNAIGMIAGGNTVVFNPHPAAKRTSVFIIDLMNQAIISEGGPPNLITTVVNPTIQSAQYLMTHQRIGLLVVTGGPAVVAVAMKSGKRVIAAGPGNPPVVVDDTADINQAAQDIVTSASCDNNIICVVEKEIIATPGAADDLKKKLINHGAVELGKYQIKRLEKILLDDNGHPNKQWIGKDIQIILKEIGMDIDPNKRLAIAETGPDHPFAKEELLMPVLPLIRVNDIHQAINLAYKLEGGCYHTAVIHSKNIDHMHEMALKMNTSIFVKNGMALAGLGLEGEGPTSFTIASPTGEGLTTARHFTRIRRCTLKGFFRIV